MTDPAVRRLVLMKSGQSGGSEVALNWVFRQIECEPGPILWVTSNLEQVAKISRRRISPMLDREPLRSLVSPRKGRDADRTTSQITFANGSLGIVTANSPAALSSDPQQFLVFDEVDRYSPSSGGEGDPLDLGTQRQETYEKYGARTVYVSTPSVDGASRIQKLYEASDQRRYFVPCPECGVLQELVWYGERKDGHRFGVLWDKSVTKEQAPATAYYGCEHCEARWSDAQRTDATKPEAGARWIATKPFAGTAGFYVHGLLSSFVELATCVRKWLEAQGDPEKLKAFWNLVMGLPYSLVAQEAPERIPVEAWGSSFDLPAPACCLLAFADVQADRLEVTVAGFGPDATLYAAEHRIFHGVTRLPDVWEDLERLCTQSWVRSDGKVIGLSAVGIDCSYDMERVLDWADQMGQKHELRFYALRGISRGIDELIVKDRLPGHAPGGQLFYNVNVDASKLSVIQRLQAVDGPGRIRFPARACFGREYFKQFRAERLVRRYVRGYPVLEWHADAGARNEALDCLAGVFGVMAWLNPALDVMEHTNSRIVTPSAPVSPRHLQVSERVRSAEPAPPPAPAAAEPPRPAQQSATPRAPEPAVRVVKRHGGGAWFESGSRRRF